MAGLEVCQYRKNRLDQKCSKASGGQAISASPLAGMLIRPATLKRLPTPGLKDLNPHLFSHNYLVEA